MIDDEELLKHLMDIERSVLEGYIRSIERKIMGDEPIHVNCRCSYPVYIEPELRSVGVVLLDTLNTAVSNIVEERRAGDVVIMDERK